MILLLLVSVAFGAPEVSATLSADGHYVVRVVPDVVWKSAEIAIAGGETEGVGPTEVQQAVSVEGWTHNQESLRVTITAVGSRGEGRTWMVEVDPFRVPATKPTLTPHRRWPFKKNRK
jgi:hypothetical protein